MSYAHTALRGVAAIFIMNFIAYVLAYLSRLVLARNLGPADYGLFYSVFTLVLFFLFFRNLGLNKAMVKYISEFRISKDNDSIKTTIYSSTFFQIISSVAFGVIFFIISEWLALSYFKNATAAPMLQILIIYTLFSIVFILLKSFFSAFQRFGIYSTIDVSKNLIILVALLIFFRFGLDVFAPVFAYVIVGPLLFILYLPFVLRTFPIFKYQISNFAGLSKKLFVFGIPVLFTGIGAKVIGYIDTIILTHFRSISEVGVYNVVLPTAMMLLFFGSAVASVVFPVFAELWAKNDRKRLNEGVATLQKYLFLIIIPLVFGIFGFSDLIIEILFGDNFIGGAMALQILVIGVLFFTVSVVNHNVISAVGFPQSVTKIIFAAALLNVVANIILIPPFGIEGAAVATTASYCLALILSTLKVRQVVNSKIPLTIWVKTSLAAGGFLLSVYGGKMLLSLPKKVELIIVLTFSFCVYLGLVFMLRLISIIEVKRYINLLLKKNSN
jgi:stage V sporulation protein B